MSDGMRDVDWVGLPAGANASNMRPAGDEALAVPTEQVIVYVLQDIRGLLRALLERGMKP